MSESLVAAARGSGPRALSEPDAKSLLARGGIAVPRGGVARTLEEALAPTRRLTPPFAFKIVLSDLLHKSEADGVALNVSGPTQAADTYQRMAGLRGVEVDGVLVEEMVSGGVEMIASVTRHPQLGPVLMVGLGGLWFELLGDVTFRLVPSHRSDVEEMLDELRGSRLLGGLRGGARLDRSALVDALMALGQLALQFSDELQEIEINPLMVLPRGVCALDAVVLLRHDDARAARSRFDRRGRRLHRALAALLDDPGVDAVIGIFLALPGTDFPAFAEIFAKATQRHPGKPIFLVLYGGSVKKKWLRTLAGRASRSSRIRNCLSAPSGLSSTSAGAGKRTLPCRQ